MKNCGGSWSSKPSFVSITFVSFVSISPNHPINPEARGWIPGSVFKLSTIVNMEMEEWKTFAIQLHRIRF